MLDYKTLTKEEKERVEKAAESIRNYLFHFPLHVMRTTEAFAIWHLNEIEFLENRIKNLEQEVLQNAPSATTRP